MGYILCRPALLLLLCALSLATAPGAAAKTHRKHDTQSPSAAKADTDKPVPPEQLQHATLWREPRSIAALDLYWGQGGKEHQPSAPFTFEEEDHHGTNPKFDVRDAGGKRWRVKLGAEARPEVVASRLLWAGGLLCERRLRSRIRGRGQAPPPARRETGKAGAHP